MQHGIQGKVNEAQRRTTFKVVPKLFDKIENVVSQSSEGVVRATGCLYDPEMILHNDWNHLQIVKITFERSKSDF